MVGMRVLGWVALCVVGITAKCSNPMDCSLNGECPSGECQCRKPWTGQWCEQLDITPHQPSYVPAYGHTPNVTSWGGNIIRDDNGTYHLFVSEMVNGCGLRTWGTNSRIVHATAKDPLDVFHRVGVALPVWAHNASPLRAPASHLQGQRYWYLFHIGSGSGDKHPKDCTGIPEPFSPLLETPMGTGGLVHRSLSPDGPWEALPSNIGCNNPAPFFHPNGTLYVGCNSGSRVALYQTHDPTTGVWTHITTLIPPTTWGSGSYLRTEDPYMWVDSATGVWHLLAHRYDYRDGYPPNPNQTEPTLVSGHAYSKDGLVWGFSDRQPYNNWMDFTDGTKRMFATLERPHLVFDGTTSRPTHLVTAASPVWGNPPCGVCDARPGSKHSCVVCKTSAGVDWDYTLVWKLNI